MKNKRITHSKCQRLTVVAPSTERPIRAVQPAHQSHGPPYATLPGGYGEPPSKGNRKIRRVTFLGGRAGLPIQACLTAKHQLLLRGDADKSITAAHQNPGTQVVAKGNPGRPVAPCQLPWQAYLGLPGSLRAAWACPVGGPARPGASEGPSLPAALPWGGQKERDEVRASLGT